MQCHWSAILDASPKHAPQRACPNSIDASMSPVQSHTPCRCDSPQRLQGRVREAAVTTNAGGTPRMPHADACSQRQPAAGLGGAAQLAQSSHWRSCRYDLAGHSSEQTPFLAEEPPFLAEALPAGHSSEPPSSRVSRALTLEGPYRVYAVCACFAAFVSPADLQEPCFKRVVAHFRGASHAVAAETRF